MYREREPPLPFDCKQLNNFDNGRQKKKAYDPRFGLYKYVLLEFGTIGIELGLFVSLYALLSYVGVCCCDLCMNKHKTSPGFRTVSVYIVHAACFNPLLPATNIPSTENVEAP